MKPARNSSSFLGRYLGISEASVTGWVESEAVFLKNPRSLSRLDWLKMVSILSLAFCRYLCLGEIPL